MSWSKIISNNATVYDTIALIINMANKYSHSYTIKEVVKEIDTKNDNLFLRRLFDYVADNVTYKMDAPNVETVTTPERLMRDKIGDCKKMTVFLSAALQFKGIPHYFKVVSYDGTVWEHIYIIVPLSSGSYITLDPVNDKKYNKEVEYSKSIVYDNKGKLMKLAALGNAPRFNDAISTVGNAATSIDRSIGEICVPYSKMGTLIKAGLDRWHNIMESKDDLWLAVLPAFFKDYIHVYSVALDQRFKDLGNYMDVYNKVTTPSQRAKAEAVDKFLVDNSRENFTLPQIRNAIAEGADAGGHSLLVFFDKLWAEAKAKHGLGRMRGPDDIPTGKTDSAIKQDIETALDESTAGEGDKSNTFKVIWEGVKIAWQAIKQLAATTIPKKLVEAAPSFMWDESDWASVFNKLALLKGGHRIPIEPAISTSSPAQGGAIAQITKTGYFQLYFKTDIPDRILVWSGYVPNVQKGGIVTITDKPFYNGEYEVIDVLENQMPSVSNKTGLSVIMIKGNLNPDDSTLGQPVKTPTKVARPIVDRSSGGVIWNKSFKNMPKGGTASANNVLPLAALGLFLLNATS